MENFVLADRAANETRIIELNNNKVYIKKANNPYGFWTLHLDKGRLPDSLMGQYTSPTEAERAMLGYLKSKGKLD